MEASIKAAEEALLAAAAKKKDQGDLGFDQLAAMDAAAEAELKAQQGELAAKKAELEAKKKAVSQGFAAPTGGEAVDLKALKGGSLISSVLHALNKYAFMIDVMIPFSWSVYFWL